MIWMKFSIAPCIHYVSILGLKLMFADIYKAKY